MYMIAMSTCEWAGFNETKDRNSEFILSNSFGDHLSSSLRDIHLILNKTYINDLSLNVRILDDWDIPDWIINNNTVENKGDLEIDEMKDDDIIAAIILCFFIFHNYYHYLCIFSSSLLMKT